MKYILNSFITSHSAYTAMSIVKDVLLKLRRLNLFVDAKTRNQHDRQVLRDQILTTRLYLVCLTASILILVLYTLLTETTVRITVNNPSLDTYKYLEATFPDTLSCPCKEISVPYSNFLSVQTTYHQVSVSL